MDWHESEPSEDEGPQQATSRKRSSRGASQLALDLCIVFRHYRSQLVTSAAKRRVNANAGPLMRRSAKVVHSQVLVR